MASYRWIVKRRNYQHERERMTLIASESQSHPLISGSKGDAGTPKTNPTAPKKRLSAYCDPLSSALEGSDPLSQFVSGDGLDTISEPPGRHQVNEQTNRVFEEWLKQRTAILAHFTTSEKLSITSSFLQGGEKLVIKQQINDKVKHRLQQIDEYEENVSEHRGLSQDDYIKIITQISEELQEAWRLDQRVKALKIVIQCSKLLLETHPMAFYPSKFVLITDILDKFGRLVFERIADKGHIKLINNQLPENFRADYLPEDARETCRNWIYKIASVRELLPRLYVEMAVLKCYSFLETSSEFSDTLIRLSRAIRGVGNPLVAAYARCYLMKVGCERIKTSHVFIEENIHDFLRSYHQLFSSNVKTEMAIQKVDYPQYLSLYTPAFDWMLQVAVEYNVSLDGLESIYRQCHRLPNPGLLWQSVIQKFPADLLGPRAVDLTLSITSTESVGVSSVHLLRLIGQLLSKNPTSESDPVKLLNIIWPCIVKLTDVDDYLSGLEAWMPYVICNFGRLEVNMILNDLVAHCSPKAEMKHVAFLNNIVQAFVNGDHVDYNSLLTNEKFVALLDLYPEGHAKAEASKMVLQQFLRAHERVIANPVMVDNVIHIARNVHDTLNAMSVEDEKRQISELVIRFIDLVDFNFDFQQMLSFYGDARAAFTNLDPVLAHLVQFVNRLSTRTRRMITQHNKRTASFVRACGAFAYITIPAIACPLTRFQLYLLSGQVSLTNECFGQADACFEAAVNAVTEVSPVDEQLLSSCLSNLLSTLLVHPDAPGQSRMGLVRRLLRTVRNYSNAHNLMRLRASIFIQALRLLSAFAQPVYIYHIANVESNDRLYIGDEEFQSQISDNCSALLSELLNDLKCLGSSHQYRQQAALCLDLFSLLLGTADLEDGDLFQLAVHLFKLAQKHGQWDADYARRLVDAVQRHASTSSGVFVHLASSLQVPV